MVIVSDKRSTNYKKQCENGSAKEIKIEYGVEVILMNMLSL